MIGKERVRELCLEYEEKFPGIRWMSTPRVWRTPGGITCPVNPYSAHLLLLEEVIERRGEYEEALRRMQSRASNIGQAAKDLFSRDFHGRDDEVTAYHIAQYVWSDSHPGTTLPGKRKSEVWGELAALMADYEIDYVASVLDTFFRIREWGEAEEASEIERFGYPIRMVINNFGRWELAHARRLENYSRQSPEFNPFVEYRRLLDAAWIAHVGAYARIMNANQAPWEDGNEACG